VLILEMSVLLAKKSRKKVESNLVSPSESMNMEQEEVNNIGSVINVDINRDRSLSVAN